VGYIPIGIPEYSWRVPKMGEYPDVLMDDAAVDIPETQDAQPFFVTAHSLAEDAAGDYAGIIRAVDAEGRKAELPLTIHRWGFSLDKETHLKTSLWMNEGFLKAFYKYPDRTPFDVRKRFYQCHLDHRISPIQSFPWGGGDMKEDFDFLMANGQNCMFLHPEQPKTDAEKTEYAAKIADTRKYLESHGWSDKTLFYSIDEVGVMQRNRIGDLHEINALARELAPEWPRLETSAPEQAMFGAVDVWCPLIDAFDPAILKQRMQQGERLWFYTVWGRPGIMIEFPSTDYRVMLWECWKYGAEGFLYWGTTHWDLNCTGDKRWPEIPWITYNRQAGHNGCGYMIYPGPDGTPLPSTRMAVLRDGIEDYECLWLLREAMKTRADKLTPEQRAEVEALLAVPDALVRDNKTFTEDPGVIENTRRAVSAWVEKLGAM
jgi:hypothetical protein